MITGNLNVIPDSDSRVCYIISKGFKYRFPSNIDFPKCRREIAASLNDFSNRWCKRENVEPDLMPCRNRKLTFLELLILVFHFTVVIHIFYLLNLNLLFKRGIQDFHLNYVLVPADKAANNVVVVLRLDHTNTLKCELVDNNAYRLQPSLSERVVVDGYGCHIALQFGVKAKENQDKIPTLYWLPKLHKKPQKNKTYC